MSLLVGNASGRSLNEHLMHSLPPVSCVGETSLNAPSHDLRMLPCGIVDCSKTPERVSLPLQG